MVLYGFSPNKKPTASHRKIDTCKHFDCLASFSIWNIDFFAFSQESVFLQLGRKNKVINQTISKINEIKKGHKICQLVKNGRTKIIIALKRETCHFRWENSFP